MSKALCIVLQRSKKLVFPHSVKLHFKKNTKQTNRFSQGTKSERFQEKNKNDLTWEDCSSVIKL